MDLHRHFGEGQEDKVRDDEYPIDAGDPDGAGDNDPVEEQEHHQYSGVHPAGDAEHHQYVSEMADFEVIRVGEPALPVRMAPEGDEGPVHILSDQCAWWVDSARHSKPSRYSQDWLGMAVAGRAHLPQTRWIFLL